MGFNSLQSGAPGGFQSFPLGKKNVACVFCFPGLDLIEMTKGSDILLREGTHRNGRQYDRKIPTLPIRVLEVLWASSWFGNRWGNTTTFTAS